MLVQFPSVSYLLLPVSWKMPFSRCTLQGLLSHKYLWPMTHFLPRHGRFCLPKRNSEVKSIVWPTGPPQVRSQNKVYCEYLIKIKEKNEIFAKFGNNLLNFWLKFVFIELLCFQGFKNCHKCAFKNVWKPSNLNWRIDF